MKIEEIKIDEPDKINILITHASLDGNYDNYREYNPLSEKKLKNIGFDYIALGHVHKRYISEDKKIVYPGSTISLGFDEIGQHGIIVGEIKNKEIDLDFIPIDDKEFVVEDLDITNIISKEELIEKINNIELENNKLYEINMVGRRNFEINKTYLQWGNFFDTLVFSKDDCAEYGFNVQEARELEKLGGFVKTGADEIPLTLLAQIGRASCRERV